MRISRLASVSFGFYQILATGFFLLLLSTSCETPDFQEPEISLEDFRLPEGYELNVIASEPLIEAPVAIDFDHKGQMWVAELRTYMSNLDATGEDLPISRILILSDRDGDGRMDHAKPFLDSLVLPRALRLYQGGLLYAEPPNLWWVEIAEDDQPGKRVLVDSLYAPAGNVEHMPNGLMVNLDNWIYSAKSNLRYRYRNGHWERSFTAPRGQWGLTHDDQGRLYYNHNFTLLTADRGLPQATLLEPHARPQHCLNANIVDHQRLYASQATWVNRGYEKGVLDESGKVQWPTSACGPLIFRGDGLGKHDQGQAFVCLPEANLIKRLALSEESGLVSAKNPPSGPDFLTSTDPYFRPVNLQDGPNGSLYIVDMHRGVIQHQAYMTSYLREKLEDSRADTVIYMGRILGLRKAGSATVPLFDWRAASNEALVEKLADPNGWLRDRAQQELIRRQANSSIPSLTVLLKEGVLPAALHAFWALEGLEDLTNNQVQLALDHPVSSVQEAALYFLANDTISHSSLKWKHLLTQPSPTLDRYLLLALPSLLEENEELLDSYWQQIASRYPSDSLLPEYAFSGLYKIPASQWPKEIPDSWQQSWQEFIQAVAQNQLNPHLSAPTFEMDDRTRGLSLYRQNCSGCHGLDGVGMANLAPSLMGSSVVAGPIEGLEKVLRYGLPKRDYPGQMPGFGQNGQLSRQELADIMAYVRNAFQ